MAPEAKKHARHFSQLSTNKVSFWHLPVLCWRYFIERVLRGRDEKSRTVEKRYIGRGDQKLKETCFWDFHIPVGMSQRAWAPSQISGFLIQAFFGGPLENPGF
jgi:predicted anti-sigma-YlaC factor YlaD